MKKLFLVALVIVLQFFGIAEPAFAGLPYGAADANWHPNYHRQIQYIQENSCDATAIVPYDGSVFYTCPSGQKFWSEVLVPSEKSPLFMYFKNRQNQDDEDARNAASETANQTAFNTAFW